MLFVNRHTPYDRNVVKLIKNGSIRLAVYGITTISVLFPPFTHFSTTLMQSKEHRNVKRCSHNGKQYGSASKN